MTAYEQWLLEWAVRDVTDAMIEMANRALAEEGE